MTDTVCIYTLLPTQRQVVTETFSVKLPQDLIQKVYSKMENLQYERTNLFNKILFFVSRPSSILLLRKDLKGELQI